MTSRERMMRAIRQNPDRLPVIINQWQQYHLDTYMASVENLKAYAAGARE